MKRLFSITVFITILGACRHKVIEVPNTHKNLVPEYTLEIQDSVIFRLDSLTPPTTFSLQYKDGKVSFLNNLINAIYVYDYKSRELLYTIPMEKEGNNGVGKIEGHIIINDDSILVQNFGKNILYLIDKNAKLKNSYNLLSTDADTIPYLPWPKGWTTTPIIVTGQKFYLGGNINGEPSDENQWNRPIMIAVNKNDKSVNYHYHYPSFYWKGNWGGALYRRIYYDYNPEKKIFVFSFPASHDIYTTSIDFKDEKKYYGGSQYFGTIKSMKGNIFSINKNMRNKHFVTNPSYESIIYDKYRKVYYRIASHPVNMELFKKGEWAKQFSIIILDENFKWLGETLIPKYSHSSIEFFVTPKGLHLKKYVPDNDDIMQFSIFTLKKIER